MLRDVDDLMPIGEFSERSGLSPKRLRSYAAGGLLVPAAIDSASGYRYYAPGQVREAQLIDALRAAGMPLADIASLLRDPSTESLDHWAQHVAVDAARRHEALDEARQLLSLAIEPGHERKGRMTTLLAAARTDVGRVRDTNEDALSCADDLIVIADGMGGAPGGEVAADLTVRLLTAAFTGGSLDELAAGVRAANAAVMDTARSRPELQGMGTTVTAVGVLGTGEVAIVNVGDSRAYLVRDGSLLLLTEDHSVTAELVRLGELSEEEAAEHPLRNVLTRAVGVGPTVEVDGRVHAPRAGDRLVVCTDGLFNEVPEEEIRTLVDSTNDVGDAADVLLDRALANGGRDNVTVVVAEVRADAA